MNADALQAISDYWYAIRPIYADFESDLRTATAEIYKYEIPGGQYSNLKPQVESFGLGHRFDEVKSMYKEVNDMLGDIVKVTPSSKMVGDMAIFMVKNDLTPENIVEKGADLAFPDSAVDYFKGMMGQPVGGFPEDIQKIVLKGEKAITCRPGELLPDENFDEIIKYLNDKHGMEATMEDALAYALYPKVFEEYVEFIKNSGDFSRMSSAVFFHGLSEGETAEVEIAEGKILLIKLVKVTKVDKEGYRRLIFEVNGYRREIKIKDKQSVSSSEEVFTKMADPDNKLEIGASIPGNVLKVLVKEGDTVSENQSLVVIEAMKMETNITSKVNGIVESVIVTEGKQVKSGELLIKLKEA